MSFENVLNTLRIALRDILGEDAEITADTLIEDLALDSIDIVELSFIAEDEFDIEFPEDEFYDILGQLKTIGDAVNYIMDASKK